MLAHPKLLTYIRTKLPFSNRQRFRKSPGHPASCSLPRSPPAASQEPPVSAAPVLQPPCVNPPGSSFTACAAPGSAPGSSVREICNQVSNPSLRPTYREVTACGGTFPDTVTYLPGYTPLSAPLPLERHAPHRLDTFRKVEHIRVAGPGSGIRIHASPRRTPATTSLLS